MRQHGRDDEPDAALHTIADHQEQRRRRDADLVGVVGVRAAIAHAAVW